MRKAYPSDISDLEEIRFAVREWTIIEPLLPKSKLRGRKRDTDLREVVNAIFYLLEEGCQRDKLFSLSILIYFYLSLFFYNLIFL